MKLVYIPEKEMSILEKSIYETIKSKTFLRTHLVEILTLVNQSYENIKKRGES